MVEVGDKLTIDHEVFDIGGNIIFEANQEVVVSKLWVSEGRWSNLCPDIWIPEKLNGVYLVDEYGIWLPSLFKELKTK